MPDPTQTLSVEEIDALLEFSAEDGTDEILDAARAKLRNALSKPEHQVEVERLPFKELPPTLKYQLEDGSYLGSCNMGGCGAAQEGWALCPVEDTDPEWMAACERCGTGSRRRDPNAPPPERYIAFSPPEPEHQEEEGGGSSKHWPRATIEIKLPMERNGATPLYCEGRKIGYRSGSETSAGGNEIFLWLALDPAYFFAHPPAPVLSDEERKRIGSIATALEAAVARGQITSPIWVEDAAFLRNLASQEQGGEAGLLDAKETFRRIDLLVDRGLDLNHYTKLHEVLGEIRELVKAFASPKYIASFLGGPRDHEGGCVDSRDPIQLDGGVYRWLEAGSDGDAVFQWYPDPDPPAGELERLQEQGGEGWVEGLPAELKRLRERLSEWHEFGLVEAAAERAYDDAGTHPRAMSAAIEAAISEGLRQFDEEQPVPPSDSQGEQEEAEKLLGIIQADAELAEEAAKKGMPGETARLAQGEQERCGGSGFIATGVNRDFDTGALEADDEKPCPPGCPDCNPAPTEKRCRCGQQDPMAPAVAHAMDCPVYPAPTQVEGDEDREPNADEWCCDSCGLIEPAATYGWERTPVDDAGVTVERCPACRLTQPEPGSEEDWPWPQELWIGGDEDRPWRLWSDHHRDGWRAARRYTPAPAQDSSLQHPSEGEDAVEALARVAIESELDEIDQTTQGTWASLLLRLEAEGWQLVHKVSQDSSGPSDEVKRITIAWGEERDRANKAEAERDAYRRRQALALSEKEDAQGAIYAALRELHEQQKEAHRAKAALGELASHLEAEARGEVSEVATMALQNAASLARQKAAELKEGER